MPDAKESSVGAKEVDRRDNRDDMAVIDVEAGSDSVSSGFVVGGDEVLDRGIA